MAGKNSDNPWAEMSRLNLDSKEAKAPAPDSARAATVDAENAGATKAPSPAAPASAAAAASPETVSEEVVEVELSADQLQEMSIDELQELAQEKVNTTPSYKLEHSEGPDHSKIFTMGAYIGERIVGKGNGGSKQNAEQAAAEDALKRLKW